jgi:hypothetical protein
MATFEADHGANAFLDYTSAELVARMRRRVFEDLDYELRRRVPRPATIHQEVHPIKLADYVHACRRTVESIIIDDISGYSAMRWFYYCRRIPNIALLLYFAAFPCYIHGAARIEVTWPSILLSST